MKKIVFLYTELAEYIKVCLDKLANEALEVHVFHYPVNPEAPFEFTFDQSKAHFYLRGNFNNEALLKKVEEIKPQAIVCSGWIDKEYVAICRALSGSTQTILALDNQYENGMKRRLSLLRARLLFKSAFADAWVPGEPQRLFAKKLGFRENRIHTGFYTVDLDRWSTYNWFESGSSFPHRFVFVGRYLKFKGINELWNAFKEIEAGDWELYCAGSGPLFANRLQHKGIHHLGFLQSEELQNLISQGGVFVLPSHKEPWGVVVHEFAAAGYPLICTHEVGAASAFLKKNLNGYSIKSNNIAELKEAMQTMINSSDEELFKMSRESRRLAGQIDVQRWVNTALHFIEKSEN